MSGPERPGTSDREVVAVTKHGQATIPKRFREKSGIDTPGKVVFRETEDGTVIVESVRTPSEMRGFAAHSEATTDTLATEILHEKRDQDREERDARFSTEE
ncbi:AbrB/MazE/SpoVT family DNA-binding domain-containing protein [Halorientalis sp.]|uniref:AbrB/MazE/SpoVT family DNA-binding domain-containing protein n=1 Tax=Halorientalis sp. TaxID=1931229 RepID=UPI00261906E7|nr:AbrB/MazE/SpoVT family DNA-binding domain-containing protein [Halorientalis sp.]